MEALVRVAQQPGILSSNFANVIRQSIVVGSHQPVFASRSASIIPNIKRIRSRKRHRKHPL